MTNHSTTTLNTVMNHSDSENKEKPMDKPKSPPIALATSLMNDEVLRSSIKKLIPPETVYVEQFCANMARYLHQKASVLVDGSFSNLRECVFEAAQFGFLMGGTFSPADIFIRNKKKPIPKLEVNKNGLMELAFRTGMIKSMEGEVIYEGDTFKCNLANRTEPVYHEPNVSRNPDSIVGVYLITEYSHGTNKAHVMFLPEMKAHQEEAKKKAGEGWHYSPWFKFLPEMCLKTLVKRACKRFPYTSGNAQVLELLSTAIGNEHAEEDKKEGSQFVPPAEKEKTKKDALDFIDEVAPVPDNNYDEATGEVFEDEKISV